MSQTTGLAFILNGKWKCFQDSKPALGRCGLPSRQILNHLDIIKHL
jgi:hypothetical protein